MTEKPILLSTEMVMAILEGRKTQIRRIMKPQPMAMPVIDEPMLVDDFTNEIGGISKSGRTQLHMVGAGKGLAFPKWPYHRVDMLWVRETWAPMEHPELPYRYKADHKNPNSVEWKPSIQMPKKAARIWLRVKAVWVERLNDITPYCAEKEGVEKVIRNGEETYVNYNPKGDDAPYFYHPKDSFRTLWESIHSLGSWEKNPWVWCIQFQRIEI